MRAERIWEARRCDESQADLVARELGISPVTARLLCIRGLDDAEGARRFLAPSLGDLHDPFRLADMSAAVDRVLAAIARHERIAITATTTSMASRRR